MPDAEVIRLRPVPLPAAYHVEYHVEATLKATTRRPSDAALAFAAVTAYARSRGVDLIWDGPIQTEEE